MATNFWYLGGDGLNVFNWYVYDYPQFAPLLNEVGDANILIGLDKMYAVAHKATSVRHYQFLSLDGTVPQDFNSVVTTFDFPMLVGEDINGIYEPIDVTVELETDAGVGDLTIKLNGTTLSPETPGSGKISVSSVDPNLVLTGWNYITIERDAGDFTVDRIHLYVDYDVVPDWTAPTPDPMTWILEPSATGPNTITMTASTASDVESSVEYYFECTAGPGNDSGWQASPVYTDTDLASETEYSYRVKARDTGVNKNETGFSDPASATTFIDNAADINIDGKVDFVDFAIFALAWHSSSSDGNWNPACELAEPANDYIDGLDLKVLMDNWLAGY